MNENIQRLTEILPFYNSIKDSLHYKKVLLLGSGITSPPNEWLNEDLKLVTFNYKTLNQSQYHHLELVCNVCWSRVLYKCKEVNRLHSKYPKYLVFTTGTKGRKNKNSNEIVINDMFRNNSSVVGKWFSFVSQELTLASHERKLYTTGFYMTLWLIWGECEEVYIAGFDCYKYRDKIYHGNKKYKSTSPNIDTHDYNLEWKFIDLAIRYAKSKGKKVFISTENQTESI